MKKRRCLFPLGGFFPPHFHIFLLQNHKMWWQQTRKTPTASIHLKTRPKTLSLHWPIWRSDKGVGRWGDGGGAKVGQFNLARLGQQDVAGLNVPAEGEQTWALDRSLEEEPYETKTLRKKINGLPVDHVVGVKVGQSLQSTVCDGSDLHFLQRLFMNWGREAVTSSVSSVN